MKGIAIFLMLWGHSIQYCIPQGLDFFENSAFKFIYSFHMPLFALISGYLFGSSIARKDLNSYAGSRVIALMQAAVCGGLFNYFVGRIPSALASHSLHKAMSWDVFDAARSLWFLWSIIGAYVAVAIAIKISDKLWVRALVLCALIPLLFALPSGDKNTYMYVYFILGVWYYKYKESMLGRLLYKVRWLCLPAFIVMLFFFKKKHYIYVTGLWGCETLIESFGVDMFRYAIGLFGSVSVLIVGKWIIRLAETTKTSKTIGVNGLARVGKKSLEIYVISSSLLSIYLPKLSAIVQSHSGYFRIGISDIVYNVVITPMIAILYMVGLYWIARLMEKVKISKFIFGR